jgi:hypothetical protein
MALPAAAATTLHDPGRAARISVAAIHVSADSADPFNLYNYNSQAAGRTLCLGISGGKDDAPAVQWPCNGHPDQIWLAGWLSGIAAGLPGNWPLTVLSVIPGVA